MVQWFDMVIFEELCYVLFDSVVRIIYCVQWQQIDKTICTSKINCSINSNSSQILFWINI